jgi:hypothetical protein
MRIARNIRARVAAAFRRLAGGVDRRTAFGKVKAFYNLGAWARAQT